MIKSKQLSLFEASDISDNLNTKPNDASPSLFGWGFQIMVALIYSLRDIGHLKKVIVEGKTEDIELYFDNKDPMFIQVKAKQKINSENDSDDKKCRDAMVTLLNTSVKVQGKYDALVYATNLPNPLKLNNGQREISWKPELDIPFEKNYNDLLDTGKSFLNKILISASKRLDKKYNGSLHYFNMDKLFITSIIYNNGAYADNERVLRNKIRSLFNNIEFNVVETITDSLFKFYFDKAATSNDNFYKQITKSELVWKIIVRYINKTSSPLFVDLDNMPLNIAVEFENYRGNFLSEASCDMGNVNRVISLFRQKYSNDSTLKEIKTFINENWSNFAEDLFPNKNQKLQEYCTKEIMWEILRNYFVIKKVKKETNML